MIEKLIELRRGLMRAGIEPTDLPYPLAIPIADLRAAARQMSAEFIADPEFGAVTMLFGFHVQPV